MGLTIHYELEYGGKEPAKVLEKLRQRAMDLPFTEVSPGVQCFKGRDADFQNHDRGSDFVWALVQSTASIEYRPKRYLSIPPKEVYLFTTWPGKGCEEANFGLAKYPAVVMVHGERIPTKLGNSWKWHSFCKTQYASKVSIEHFLRCHYTVCMLLKEAKKIGVLKDVNDDGGFWDNWDFESLAREVSEWNHMILGAVKQLKAILGEGKIWSAIED